MKTKDFTPLSSLRRGQKAVVCSISHINAVIYNRLLAFGLVEGTEIEVRGAAPLGDPINVVSAGTEISLRKVDASAIRVKCI